MTGGATAQLLPDVCCQSSSAVAGSIPAATASPSASRVACIAVNVMLLAASFATCPMPSAPRW